ncbi:MAG: rRNA pseudouridine synthase [Bdellovibrionaceae bacterium]|jgi:23S rRNA pseudouridine2605 synthase|nr:rRNA pseudouridine synthase [Pseudobdellovibrionaceae bacterium]
MAKKATSKRKSPVRKKVTPKKVNSNPDEVRLNKWISSTGLMSRRKADEAIDEGKIKINGRVVYELGVKINPKLDVVKYQDKALRPPKDKTYIMFNKPKKVLTTMADPTGRTTIGDFFPANEHLRLFPIGRLDWETEGLLLLTNDGEFSQEVIHPKSKIPKTYLVKLDGKLNQYQTRKLLSGVTIIGGRVKALHIERVKKLTSKVENKEYEWVRISISEGKNRQIRKMFAKVGLDVKKLRRVAIGSLKLGTLATGKYKELQAKDLLQVFEHVQFKPMKELKKSDSSKKASTTVNKNARTKVPRRSTKK